MADYDSVMALLGNSSGLALRSADSPEATKRYLERNPGLSFVAKYDTRIVGCVMCGHDGRRGYLQHLAVDSSYRGRGIGTALVERCLAELSRLGIDKAHLDVLVANEPAHRYWTGRGWKRRDEIVRYSYTSSTDTNA